MDKNSTVATENELIQGHPMIQSLVTPVETELKKQFNIDLKLLDLRKIANDRHNFAYEPTRSIEQQRCFFSLCANYVFPENYKFTHILQNIIVKLLELDPNVTDSKLKYHK